MATIPFIKMHGAGNDFVVIDNRAGAHEITARLAQRLGHRQFGIGCDQLVALESSDKADSFMRIFNADGSEISACGNATRCVGWRIMQEKGTDRATIETRAGVLACERAGEHQVRVDMGEPRWDWAHIPLSEPRNTEHLGIAEGPLMDPVAVNIGNPHMVFFVRDLEFINLGVAGPKLERHALYPEGCNVSVAQVLSRDHMKLKVWERGAGQTLACGTAACATLVAAVRRGLTERQATLSLPGGDLLIDWRADNHIHMTGPVAEVFEGRVDQGLLR